MRYTLAYFFMFLFLTTIPIISQAKVNNVKVTQTVDEILIQYDMTGEEKEEYDVKLFLMRENMPSFKYPILGAKGDVGKIVFSKGQKIIRYPLDNSYIQFNPEVEDFYFLIEVYETGSGFPWYYYAVGGVLTGGIAAILLLIKDGSETEKPVTIGSPPVRP